MDCCLPHSQLVLLSAEEGISESLVLKCFISWQKPTSLNGEKNTQKSLRDIYQTDFLEKNFFSATDQLFFFVPYSADNV